LAVVSQNIDQIFGEAVQCACCGSTAGIMCDRSDEELALNIFKQKQKCSNENYECFLPIDEND